jgi:L-fuculose-phosphate aldolase
MAPSMGRFSRKDRMISEAEQLEGICDICARLHARNLLAAGDGNVSALLEDGRIAITPSGVAKARLKPSDMAFLSPEGAVLTGRPSTEQFMHLAIYRACPEARCVVHAHPPTAVAWTVARPELHELPSEGLPELILAAGRIPVVPYARPGSEGMGTALGPFLPEHRLLLLARHGAVCWGEDLEEAYLGMERLEHVAQILKAAVELGGISAMNVLELDALRQARKQTGPRIR